MTTKSVLSGGAPDEPLVLVGEATIDRMPGLSLIFEETGASFGRFLGRYAEDVVLSVENFEALRVAELIEQHGGSGKLYFFRAEELYFPVIVVVDGVCRNLAFELLLGSGVFDSSSDRPSTRIDDRIVGFAVAKLLSGFSEAFSHLAPLSFEREPSLENSGFLALGPKGAVIAFVKMTLRYHELSGHIVVATPRTALDPFRAELSRLPSADGKANDEKWSENLYKNVVRTDIKAEVRIEARGFTLGDIARLEVGDVVRLPIEPTSPIRVVSEGRTLFWCTLGQKDGKYTIRLEEFSDERESYVENILGV